MSYATERRAIETYLNTQWSGATPIGFDGHEFEPTANSIRVTIQNGQVLQGSIGAAANRIDHVGLVSIQIFTESGFNPCGHFFVRYGGDAVACVL